MNNRYYHHNFTIDEYDAVESTNDLALNLARNYQIDHNHIITAKKQINGHGRYGKDWDSPLGNLYFSLLLKPKNKIQNQYLLSFVAAISLSQTILHFSNNKDLNISHKWPNDILLNNKKTAGILLKSDNLDQDRQIIIIGIGLNLISHPENTNFIATNLAKENIKNINSEDILKEFLNNFTIFYNQFINLGFEPIRNLWIKRAFMLNKKITANLFSQKTTGTFKNLNNSGNLILEDDNKNIKTISCDEIFSF